MARLWLALLLVWPTWARAQEEIELPEGLSTLPELVSSEQAAYPQAALDEAVQADVLFQISIDEGGRISEAVPTALVLYTFDENDELVEEWLAPEDDPYGFVESARQTLDRFVFTPALDDAGEPVAVALVWRYGFYFQEEETAVEVEEPSPEPEGADVVNLRGELIERGTRDPIGGAEVRASTVDELVVTVTDAQGVFEFRGLSPGTWRIEVDPAGFESVAQDEEIVAGERTDLRYYVERESYGEYTYEVRE